MKDKTKIYIFHPYSKIGGADLSISRLVNNLNKNNFDIDFLYLNKQSLSKYINKRKINYVNIRSERSLFSIPKVRNYLKKDKQKKYKKYIFLSNQNFANVISFIILFKLSWIKQVLVERNHIDEFKVNTSLKNRLIFFLMKHLYKRAHAIIGISKKLSKDLSDHIGKRCFTIYNPAFDKKIFNLSKEKISLPPKKNTILAVGRLEIQKDMIIILKAFKNLLKNINANLLIIGYGSQFYILKNYIKKNNLSKNVKILKNVKNPFPYYKLADTFVLSSKYEGFGNVLVEAAMFKINIISTDCNSGPREILLNGRYGQLFRVGDYKKLSKLMLNSLKQKNLYNKNGLYKSLKRFSVKQNIKNYIKLFKKI